MKLITKAYAEMSAGKARETLYSGRGGTAKQAGRLAEERRALSMMSNNQLRQSGNRYAQQTAGRTGR